MVGVVSRTCQVLCRLLATWKSLEDSQSHHCHKLTLDATEWLVAVALNWPSLSLSHTHTPCIPNMLADSNNITTNAYQFATTWQLTMFNLWKWFIHLLFYSPSTDVTKHHWEMCDDGNKSGVAFNSHPKIDRLKAIHIIKPNNHYMDKSKYHYCRNAIIMWHSRQTVSQWKSITTWPTHCSYQSTISISI